jgi:hypothetical protein
MKKEDVDDMLNDMDLPDPENIMHQQELKIPLLSFKRSSRAGLWLLVLPLIFMITVFLKYELGIISAFLNIIESFFTAINGNMFLTYLIPVIFVGLPLFAMSINFLAFCHFTLDKTKKELLVTIKYRPFNIAVFLFSFAILVFAFLPDSMP